MPKFVVPVSFAVEADSADHSTEVVEKLLANLGPIVGEHFTVYQGHRTDVTDVQVSAELQEFLDDVVTNNDHDVSGWDTDLDWAFAVADDNDDVPDNVRDELTNLINQVGGEVKVANLLGD
jgi:hypothetical protein